MAIRGTSAGGLTALAALVRSRVFAGAVAWYGVTDLAALAADTHDFESRYMDGLVGPLPAVRRRRTGTGRPSTTAADLVGRVLLLQGPTTRSCRSTRPSGSPPNCVPAGPACELAVFPGEGHGFRPPATIEAALDAELGFYRSCSPPEATAVADAVPGTGAWRSAVAWLRGLSADQPRRLPLRDVGASSPA